MSSWVKPLRARGKIVGWQATHVYCSCCQCENVAAQGGSVLACSLTMGMITCAGTAHTDADTAITLAQATRKGWRRSLASACLWRRETVSYSMQRLSLSRTARTASMGECSLRRLPPSENARAHVVRARDALSTRALPPRRP